MKREIDAHFKASRGEFYLDARFTLPGQGVSALFGHSGSGKTTLLRCIAGLEPNVDGSLTVDGQCWQSSGSLFIPPHKRPIGYVFQEANLFAHLNVQQNITFGERRLKPHERSMRFDDVVAMLGISHLLERAVTYLSGGERQRVAIARALLTSPKLLLMDEPLSALDEQSRQDILPYLERLHDELSTPIIYVSHSQKEVSRLADYLVWLEQGKVQAEGSLQQVMGRFDLAATHGDEAGEVVIARVVQHDEYYCLSRLQCCCGELWVKRVAREVGDEIRVHIPAKDVSITLEPATDSSIQNIWPMVVDAISEVEQGQVMLQLRAAGSRQSPPLLSRITLKSFERLQLSVASHCYAQIKSVGLLS